MRAAANACRRAGVRLGTRLLSARTAARLRRKAGAEGEQARALSRLSGTLSRAAVWKAAGVEQGMAYRLFRERIPLATYEDLSPHIERMKQGEASVLWPGHCSNYAISSGTTAGRTKYLPVTGEMLAHFRKAGLDSLLFYTARTGHAGIFRGRHLFLGGSTALSPVSGPGGFAARAGDLSGIAALNLPSWVARHLYEPGAQIAQMTDWPAKIAAIVERTRGRDITVLAGIPSWTLILARALLDRGAPSGARPSNLRELWPRFECYIHGGVPVAPFQDELRALLGPDVRFHEVYPASEAFIAAQDAGPEDGLRLMTGAGVFYEFVPVAEFDPACPDRARASAVPLAGVRAGVDYALVLTTPAGLCRYVIGDVVRFVSTRPPRLLYVGRTSLQLSAFGEHVIEKELTDSLAAASRRGGWAVADFHVAPLFADAASGRMRGRHEWWIEPRPGAPAPDGPGLAAELDAELQRRNDDYEAKRLGGGLDAPIVRIAPPGTFERWLRERGKWGGQNKTPRCRSDRAMAAELEAGGK